MMMNSSGRGRGGRGKAHTRALLSAEALSLASSLPINHFLSKGNVRVTTLDPSTVVETEAQIRDNLIPQRGYVVNATAFKSSTPKRKPKAPSKEVEDAIRSVGGTLALLNEKERGAVLSRINGAYGFKTQDKQSKADGGKTAKKKEKPIKEVSSPLSKSAFNASYEGTVGGALLHETSKRFKEFAQSTKTKASPSLHAVHSHLLKMKGEVKTQFARDGELETKLPIPEELPIDPAKSIDDMVQSVDILKKVLEENPLAQPADPVSPADLVAAGVCLLQGTQHPLLTILDGKIPDKDAWGETSAVVPRTTEEEAERVTGILAQKERKKASKKRKHDAEAAATSSDPSDDQATKVHFKESPKGETEAMVVDQS